MNMITAKQVLQIGDKLLIGIGTETAVLDFTTNNDLLQNSLRALREPHMGLVCVTLGHFGIYSVTLNVNYDDAVSIFIDGPELGKTRTQSAAIWVGKSELEELLADAMRAATLQ
jgi:hypothetical protein